MKISSRLDDPAFVKKVSIAGLILAAFFLLSVLTATSFRSQRLLEDAQRRERLTADKLESALLDLSQAREDIGGLVVMNTALSEQIRRLGQAPIVDSSPSSQSTTTTTRPASTTTTTRPGTTTTTQPSPTTTAPPPPPSPEPEPDPDPPVLGPICSLTEILNLC